MQNKKTKLFLFLIFIFIFGIFYVITNAEESGLWMSIKMFLITFILLGCIGGIIYLLGKIPLTPEQTKAIRRHGGYKLSKWIEKNNK